MAIFVHRESICRSTVYKELNKMILILINRDIHFERIRCLNPFWLMLIVQDLGSHQPLHQPNLVDKYATGYASVQYPLMGKEQSMRLK